MEISDVRVKLIQEPNDRLKAVCSITLGGVFVVRDLKVVDGTQGLFVAMPSRKLTSHCQRCGGKNHLKARFCNECGSKLPPGRPPAEGNGRTKLHRDIAHPITTEFREQIQTRIIEGYRQEMELAKQPGYAPKDVDESDDPMDPPSSAEGEPTEYDALIAGLRGREKGGPASKPSGGREGGRSRTNIGRPDPDAGRGPDGERPNDGDARPKPRSPRGEPSPTSRGPERREAPPARPSHSMTKPTAPVVATPDDHDEPFGTGL